MVFPAIRLESVTKSFYSRTGQVTAVKNLSFEIGSSRFVSLLGTSGSGKSTVLNMVAGLIAPDQGRIEIRGKALSGLNKDATYLFQQDVLLPWKTVLENVVLGLHFSGEQRDEADEAGMRWLTNMGLAQVAASYPYQLSGGMRRRTAIAQNWILNRHIILMDEPFSALDVHTRVQMETELLALWSNESPRTVLFVTHDLEEAIRLSDEVIVLKKGPEESIIARHEIDLPRPRDAAALRSDPSYHALYSSLWRDLQPGARALA